MRLLVAVVLCWSGAAAVHRQRQAGALRPVPETRRVPKDDDAMVNLCDESLSMGLEKERLAYSNLGGHGPDISWKDGMVIGNLFSEMSVDMGITVQGTYYPFNVSHNTVSGDMIVISLTPGTSVTLKASFSDRMMNPVVLDKFMMTVGGFDMLPGRESAKTLNISGFKSFSVSDSSLVNITETRDYATFGSMGSGTLSTESMHALDMTEEEKDRAVVFRFRNVSEFTFTLSVGPGSQNREFFIGGQSNIVCPTRARCHTFTCPEYYNRKTNAEDTYCVGEACTTEDDTMSCCYTAIPENCQPQYTLMFPPNCVEYSNLGGLGPDTDKPEGILYKNIFPESNEEIDMLVTADGHYSSSNSSNNGQYGAYGIINVDQGTKVKLQFRFLHATTGAPRSVNASNGYYFTIYDFDHQEDGHGQECVTTSGFIDFTVSSTTTVEVSRLPHNQTKFKSTAYGTESDNPKEPTNLTQHDMDKTVSLLFSGTSAGFDMELEVTSGWSGRNFEFTGYSTLPCPNASLCTTYSCPIGWTRQPDARETMCKTMPCTDDDLTTCCAPVQEERAQCTTLVCPRYSVLRPEARSIQCSSSQCSSRDIDTCCILENCDPRAQMDLSNVILNNLAGQGPDSGEQAIVYGDVFPGSGQHVDLHVTVNSSMSNTSSDPALNGKFGKLGVVNLQTNASLTFTFRDNVTNSIVSSMSPYYFSIFAFGRRQAAHGLTVHMNDAWGRMFRAESTMFTVDEAARSIYSSQSVRIHDLPTNAYAIDTRQQRYTLSTEIAASQFTLGISMPSPGDFFFAGGSVLGCPMLKSCLSYVCPVGYRLKDTAPEEVCQGETCTEDDLFVCCACDDVRALEFLDGSIVENTLGIQSADVEQLFVSNVFPHVGHNVGLRVRPRGRYYAHNATQNRLNGQFLQLNVQAGSAASFRFEFVDQLTQEPYRAPAFFFSVFDLDQQGDGGCVESVSLSKVDYYRLSEQTTVVVEDGWFRSSEVGSRRDNPAHPFALTSDHLHRSVSYLVPAGATDFRLDVEIGGGWSSGRNVLVAGGSNVVCPERALCTTHTCPEGFALVNSADRKVCAGATCTDKDTDECCEGLRH